MQSIGALAERGLQEAQEGLTKLQDLVGQLLERGVDIPGRSRESREQLSVMVTRISIRSLTKWNGDLSRRNFPNCRGGVPFHMTGAQLGERSILAHRCGFCANNRQSRQLRHNTYPGEERAAEEVTWGRLLGKETGYVPLVERCSCSRPERGRNVPR